MSDYNVAAVRGTDLPLVVDFVPQKGKHERTFKILTCMAIAAVGYALYTTYVRPFIKSAFFGAPSREYYFQYEAAIQDARMCAKGYDLDRPECKNRVYCIESQAGIGVGCTNGLDPENPELLEQAKRQMEGVIERWPRDPIERIYDMAMDKLYPPKPRN